MNQKKPPCQSRGSIRHGVWCAHLSRIGQLHESHRRCLFNDAGHVFTSSEELDYRRREAAR